MLPVSLRRKAGQGRITTRPFSLPRTLIIDTTRLKAKFRTIDEQFTQNVIIDFLLREALAGGNAGKLSRFASDRRSNSCKRAEETTRRSLTVTEEVVYQMSELKAGINLETGRKYSNDEIFSTLLARRRKLALSQRRIVIIFRFPPKLFALLRGIVRRARKTIRQWLFHLTSHFSKERRQFLFPTAPRRKFSSRPATDFFDCRRAALLVILQAVLTTAGFSW